VANAANPGDCYHCLGVSLWLVRSRKTAYDVNLRRFALFALDTCWVSGESN